MHHRTMFRVLFPLALSGLSGPAVGQQGTDIFVGRLALNGGRLAVSELKDATDPFSPSRLPLASNTRAVSCTLSPTATDIVGLVSSTRTGV